MSIKIKIVNELDIDLNAYYPQFPKALQTSIANAIADLAGGKTKGIMPPPTKLKHWGDAYPLTHDLRVCKLGRVPKRYGAQKSAHDELARVFGRNEFLMSDAKKCLMDSGADGGTATTMLCNLVYNKVITVETLK